MVLDSLATAAATEGAPVATSWGINADLLAG